MKLLITIFSVLFILILVFFLWKYNSPIETYGAPPYIDNDAEIPDRFDKYPDFSDWKRPEGPLKVGIQAGHWKTEEMPDEQSRLRDRGGGTSFGQVTEWSVNLAIAEETAKLLAQEGIQVDILPSTIPPGYWADVFVSIHADGSTDSSMSGFKVAAPRRDYTGKADALVRLIEEEYDKLTDMPKDPNITRNMTGYYAFAWWRFEHAIHPMTPAAIFETGFLTNPSEADLLINNPEIPAHALSNAIIVFLNEYSEIKKGT